MLALSLAAASSLVQAQPLPDTRLQALPFSAALPQDTPAQVALGRLLFFDPILSATQDVACATCHHPQHGWADARPTPLGVHGLGLGPQRRLVQSGPFLPLRRNTPTLLNVGFNGIIYGGHFTASSAPMFWDNREHSLEAQALHPIRSPAEMLGTAVPEAQATHSLLVRLRRIPEYQRLFMGDITLARITSALAAFQRTLVTPASPFDRYMRGQRTALSPLQQKGMQRFQQAGCALCHNGPMFSDYQLHSIGLSEGENGRHEFRTPTLRNLRYTAPYMHHGGSTTLDEVLLFYDRLMDHAAEALEGGDASTLPPLDPLLRHMNLLPEDHAPIAAFLDALNSDDYDRTIPARVPSGLPLPGS